TLHAAQQAPLSLPSLPSALCNGHFDDSCHDRPRKETVKLFQDGKEFEKLEICLIQEDEKIHIPIEDLRRNPRADKRWFGSPSFPS
ncbi:hypothetical protein CRENBAI_009769, partial [Crenichthys baileyi]